jgi:hypothetical protein
MEGDGITQVKDIHCIGQERLRKAMKTAVNIASIQAEF